jgi:hypothetical protein
MATIIGERFHEWEGFREEVPYDWLALCFLATVSNAESESMLEAGKLAKQGGYDEAIQALLEIRRARKKKEGVL